MDKRRALLEAFDRRVRPIYDALDSRNAKTALKLAIAALEKYPDSNLIKALKSVALLRTGRHDEAHKVCDELVSSPVPLDEQTLHLLLLTLKDLQRPHDIVTIYEAAHARDPNNLEFMFGLFNSHVRQGNVSKQQQVATKLNKLSPSSRHLWWIVLSVMLQARTALQGDSVAALDPAKLMQLAESMVARQTSKDGRLDGYEALLLYLDLLLAQGKSREALEVVTGPLGSVATMAAERAHLQAVLLMTVGDSAAAASLLQAQLYANPDDWSSLQLYCECLMRPQAEAGDAAAEGSSGDAPAAQQARWPESSLLRLSGGLAELFPGAGAAPRQAQTPGEQRAGYEAAQATVARLVELVEAPPAGNPAHKLTMRGPYLASVETAYRAAQIGLVSSSAVAEAALAYIQRQGHLVSCAADLRPYTSRMGAEPAAWLAEQLQALTRRAPDPAADAAQPAEVKAVRRIVCCHQVLDDLGMPRLTSPQEAVAHAGKLMVSYAQCQALYSGLDERERGPADELPTLAAASLVTAAACCSDEGQAVAHLVQAVLLLESCVRSRPYSAPMRLGLAALYSLLGCPEAVLAQCRRLEIKNIQLDSLSGHHLLPALLAYCPSSQDQLRQLLKEVLQLYNDHRKDAGETLAKAYECATYTKVLEFVAFRERLSAAHTRAVARAERVLLDVCQATNVSLEACASALSAACAALPLAELPQLASTGASRLRFNEDLSTRPAWYPPSSSSVDLVPAAWWQARGTQSGQGYGRRWWASTASAEGSAQGAAEFRGGKHAAVRARWLLPHLLASVAQAPGAPHGPALRELLRDLEACCGVDPACSLGEQLGERTQALDSGAAPAPSDFNLLLVATCRVGCQLAAVMQGGAAAVAEASGADLSAAAAAQGEPEASGLCPELAPALVALAASIQRGVADAGQCSHQVLPGSWLNASSVLLQQHLSWLGLFIQVWHRFTKQPSYKKVKAEPEVEQAHGAMAGLKGAVLKACAGLGGVLEPASKAAAPGLEGIAQAGGDAAGLWGWREGFDAAGRMHEVWKEQSKVARVLLELCSQLSKTLGALAL